MDYPKFIVSNQKEDSISTCIQRVKILINMIGDRIDFNHLKTGNYSRETHDQMTHRAAFHCSGAQWLSGRVLDSRPRGRGFEPHRRHCVVVVEQGTFIPA